MKTLVIGDSFVQNKNTTYAHFLSDIQSNVTVRGLSGSGNDLISYLFLTEYKKFDRFVIN